MTIGLLDADLLDGGTRFPNLALMKISSFYRRISGTALVLNREDATACDKIFVSKVFTKTSLPRWINDVRERSEFGGAGFALYDAKPLPEAIEHAMPDYNLYAPFIATFEKRSRWQEDYDSASIGFTTRGCFRRCEFCVNRDKTESVVWSPLFEFYDASRKYVVLLDDNVFACRDQRKIFEDLEATGKRFCFKQGLDLRLLTKERAKFLERAKYYGDVIFAFDNVDDATIFVRKCDLYRGICGKKPTKAYLLCGFFKNGVDELCDVFTRLEILSRYKILPYVMRHEKCLNDEFAPVYVDIARWANQPAFFKKMSFDQFVARGGSKKTKNALANHKLTSIRKFFEQHFWTAI